MRIKLLPATLLLISCFVFNLTASAQKTLELQDNRMLPLRTYDSLNLRSGDNVIKAEGVAYDYGTAIPVSFVKTLIQNGFIDDNAKNKASSKLRNFNYQEFDYDAGITWYHRWSDTSFFKGSITSIGLKQRSINQIRFSRDAFNLIFFGNAMYAGDTARLGGSKYLGLNFRQLQFGWQKSFGNKDSTCSFYIGVSLLQGINANDFAASKGNLYTEPYGEYLDLNSSFLYWTTDSVATKLQTFKGVGASVDLVLSFPLSKRSRFTFYMNDLGFIRWNGQSRGYGQDTSIHYEGLAVNNILSFQDSSFLKINKDTILNRTGVKRATRSFTTFLPTNINIVYSLNIMHDKATLKAGIHYTPSFDPYPLVFVSISCYRPKFVYPSFMVSAGGSEGINAGFALSKAIDKRIFISVGSENLLGIISQKQFTSASAFASLSAKF